MIRRLSRNSTLAINLFLGQTINLSNKALPIGKWVDFYSELYYDAKDEFYTKYDGNDEATVFLFNKWLINSDIFFHRHFCVASGLWSSDATFLYTQTTRAAQIAEDI